jgi:hypothetical protein
LFYVSSGSDLHTINFSPPPQAIQGLFQAALTHTTGTYLHQELQKTVLIALMMEAVRTSEMLVNFYQTTWRYSPEDHHLRNHRRENLKSYLVLWLLVV